MTIGKAIETVRNALGITKHAAAEYCGMGTTTFAHYESGVRDGSKVLAGLLAHPQMERARRRLSVATPLQTRMRWARITLGDSYDSLGARAKAAGVMGCRSWWRDYENGATTCGGAFEQAWMRRYCEEAEARLKEACDGS